MKEIVINHILSAVYWFLGVVLICLALSTIQLYQRDATLDGVRQFDFNIYESFLSEPGYINTQRLATIQKHLQVLRFNNGYVLFPLALYTANSCIENITVDISRSICKKLGSRNKGELIKKIKNVKRKDYYRNQIFEYKGDYFLYSQLGDSKDVLIGDAGHYAHIESELRKFIYFLKTKWSNLFFEKFNSVVMRKSGELWAFIGLIALVLFTGIRYRAHKNWHEVNEAKHNLRNLESRWVQHNDRLKDVKEELIAAKMNIKEYQKEVEQKNKEIEEIYELADKESNEKELKEKQIKELVELVKHLEKEKKELEDKIKLTELETAKTREKIRKKVKKLDSRKKAKELHEANIKIERLAKLWQRDVPWPYRFSTEEKEAPCSGRTPFSITQGFIALEKWLRECAGINQPNCQEIKMQELINRIYEEGYISSEDKNFLHEVRIARNNWFHDGKYPKKGLMKQLSDFLNERAVSVIV